MPVTTSQAVQQPHRWQLALATSPHFISPVVNSPEHGLMPVGFACTGHILAGQSPADHGMIMMLDPSPAQLHIVETSCIACLTTQQIGLKQCSCEIWRDNVRIHWQTWHALLSGFYFSVFLYSRSFLTFFFFLLTGYEWWWCARVETQKIWTHTHYKPRFSSYLSQFINLL